MILSVASGSWVQIPSGTRIFSEYTFLPEFALKDFFTRINVLNRSTCSRIVLPSSSAYIFEQNISNLNCLPTHNSILNIFDAILDVVSLEKSKGLGDELSIFTCPILNHSGDALHVMLKQRNLQAKIGSNLAPYCITRLTYLQSLS